ncbi:MAG: 50S ribosomal protein L3 [Sphaerochaetaceae bacterium]|jgi:large subunit ribosomal protein L3|nr:50S ribosomal protein L3 [Sphaerochaetaceae bacterium]NLO59768.1 50S ribosomal protein L3 [Spirochaetales bacterium]MDD2405183.1 50S ribosomal protein L3 [Sphaerochaetaceae bacterium]MDD3670936.1 50S ribosomal protein L3 [Sphaerochaetaceae bacterium]MDD4258845.1 50S ribosomal protein L3 [Sphaerochaetaceae bacterium]
MLGLIGKKIGMTQVFDANGKLTPVTVIKIEDNVVVENRTVEKHGYSSCVLGSFDKKKSQTTKPYAGQFEGVCAPKKTLVEMRDFDKEAAVGEVMGVNMFKDVMFVDVVGTSKGKGFQGGMKRHGFAGGRATHGSKFHRDIGGTAMSSSPSKTFKGKKMAGRMGNERVTVQNLRVIRVDEEMQVLLVKGAIPGPAQSVVIVQKAKKK